MLNNCPRDRVAVELPSFIAASEFRPVFGLALSMDVRSGKMYNYILCPANSPLEPSADSILIAVYFASPPPACLSSSFFFFWAHSLCCCCCRGLMSYDAAAAWWWCCFNYMWPAFLWPGRLSPFSLPFTHKCIRSAPIDHLLFRAVRFKVPAAMDAMQRRGGGETETEEPKIR